MSEKKMDDYTGDACPLCGKPLEAGFGLAGGGYGPYMYCEDHGVISKSQDHDATPPQGSQTPHD